jgi:hypothetical protein
MTKEVWKVREVDSYHVFLVLVGYFAGVITVAGGVLISYILQHGGNFW